MPSRAGRVGNLAWNSDLRGLKVRDGEHRLARGQEVTRAVTFFVEAPGERDGR